MGYIKTLHARRRVVQTHQLAHRIEAGRHTGTRSQSRGQGNLSVRNRQCLQLRTITTHGMHNVDGGLCPLGKHFGHHDTIFNVFTEDDLPRYIMLKIILRHKGVQDFCISARRRRCWIKRLVTQIDTVTNKEHLHTTLPSLGQCGDIVDITTVTHRCTHVGDRFQAADLIAKPRSFFKFQCLAGFVHSRGKIIDHLMRLALEDTDRHVDIGCIVVR